MRVFLDTNVLVSAHTARGLSADLFRLVLAEHVLLVGDVVLQELRRVLRDRFRVPAELVAAIERDLRLETVVPRPAAPWNGSLRDPDDAWIVASAVLGAADLLVSGDPDVLDASDRLPVPTLAPRPAWERLRRPP